MSKKTVSIEEHNTVLKLYQVAKGQLEIASGQLRMLEKRDCLRDELISVIKISEMHMKLWTQRDKTNPELMEWIKNILNEAEKG